MVHVESDRLLTRYGLIIVLFIRSRWIHCESLGRGNRDQKVGASPEWRK
jgi:hypothetical protein